MTRDDIPSKAAARREKARLRSAKNRLKRKEAEANGEASPSKASSPDVKTVAPGKLSSREIKGVCWRTKAAIAALPRWKWWEHREKLYLGKVPTSPYALAKDVQTFLRWA